MSIYLEHVFEIIYTTTRKAKDTITILGYIYIKVNSAIRKRVKLKWVNLEHSSPFPIGNFPLSKLYRAR